MFSALGTGCMCSPARHRLHVFPRLALFTCFPALDTGYMSPALGTRCMFSRAWHRLHVFPRLAPVVCFPELGNDCMFSSIWQRLHVVPCLSYVFSVCTRLQKCFKASSPPSKHPVRNLVIMNQTIPIPIKRHVCKT